MVDGRASSTERRGANRGLYLETLFHSVGPKRQNDADVFYTRDDDDRDDGKNNERSRSNTLTKRETESERERERERGGEREGGR